MSIAILVDELRTILHRLQSFDNDWVKLAMVGSDSGFQESQWKARVKAALLLLHPDRSCKGLLQVIQAVVEFAPDIELKCTCGSGAENEYWIRLLVSPDELPTLLALPELRAPLAPSSRALLPDFFARVASYRGSVPPSSQSLQSSPLLTVIFLSIKPARLFIIVILIVIQRRPRRYVFPRTRLLQLSLLTRPLLCLHHLKFHWRDQIQLGHSNQACFKIRWLKYETAPQHFVFSFSFSSWEI
jgi:hypothetical protein